MPTSNEVRSKREILKIRIKAEERHLIDRAIIAASPEAYAEFLTRLDMPPCPNARLQKTMQALAPWDNV